MDEFLKTCKLAPREKQDRLGEGFLKTEVGSYIPVSEPTCYYVGGQRLLASVSQDKLDEGLIKFKDDSYHSFDSIDEVYEMEDICFIATAVYGNWNAPQVVSLRKFRDEMLARSAVGRAVIDSYYDGAGKRAAGFLEERVPWAIPFVRWGLGLIAERYPSDEE